MNTAMATFNTTVRQMIECLSDLNVSAKNDWNVSAKKKQTHAM